MRVDRNGRPAARAIQTYETYQATLQPYKEFKGNDKHGQLVVGQQVLCHGVPATLMQLADEAKNIPCIVEVESGGVKRTLRVQELWARRERSSPHPPAADAHHAH